MWLDVDGNGGGNPLPVAPPPEPPPAPPPDEPPAQAPPAEPPPAPSAPASSSTPYLVGLPDGRVFVWLATYYGWVPDIDTFHALGLDWNAIVWLGSLPGPEGAQLVSLAGTPLSQGDPFGPGTPAPPSPPPSSSLPPLPGGGAPFPDPATWQGTYVNAADVQTYIDLGYDAATALAWQRAVNESLAARGIAPPSSHGPFDPSPIPDGTVTLGDDDGAVRETQSATVDEYRPAGVVAAWRSLVDVFKLDVPKSLQQVNAIQSNLVEVFK